MYLVARRIVHKRISKEGVILKMDITKKMLPDTKQSWRFAKIAEAENKDASNCWGKFRKERKN